MTNHELGKVVQEIIFRYNIDRTQIARKIGRSRSYLSFFINLKKAKPVSEKMLATFKTHYPDVFSTLPTPGQQASDTTSMQVILSMAESNKMLAQSTQSLAKSFEELVILLKKRAK